MDQEKINKDLAESSSSPLQDYVLRHIRSCATFSSSAMSSYYASWDAADGIYRAWRPLDKEDNEAVRDGKTPKIIVPVTYAQVQAYLSFAMSTFMQKDNFYEVVGRGSEDQVYSEGIQRDLNYQLERTQFPLHLYYALLDSVKYGFCVLKNSWVTDKERIRTKRVVTRANPMAALNMIPGFSFKPITQTIEEVGEVISYEGNQIENIPPFSFFPDPNHPIADFQRGSYVGHEVEKSLSSIRNLEGDLYFGTDKVKTTFASNLWNSRTRRRTASGSLTNGLNFITNSAGDIDLKGNCILTEVFFKAVPKEVTQKVGIDCGNETTSEMFVGTMANDIKVIRFERCSYLHGKFPYAIGEYSPDNNTFCNPGLCGTIQDLQEIVTWTLNSHIRSVESVIKNRFLINESFVNVADFESGKSTIRVTKAGNFDSVVKQLDVRDVTQSNISDSEVIHQLIQLVTGINENSLGQYATGRRSATEAASVNNSAASRLKMHVTLLYTMCFEPLGRLMLSNTRQWRTPEVYANILGDDIIKYPYENTILTEAGRIAGGYDFMPYSPLLPAERQDRALILKEIFSMLVQNPATIQLLNKNPVILLDHIAELLGVRDLKRFNMQAEGVPQQPLVGQGLASPQAQVVPDEQAQEVASRGAQPVDLSGMDNFRGVINGQTV